MYALQTDKLKFELDKNGYLKSLSNLSNGHDYAGGGGLWRLVYSCGQELERMASAEVNIPQIAIDENTVTMEYQQLTGEFGETLDIKLKLSVKSVGDELWFAAEIINNAPGIEVRELHFPLIVHCNVTSGQRLLWSSCAGQRFDDVEKFVRSAHTNYIAKDNYEIRRSVLYPGFAATNSFVLENDNEGLYFASYDPTFQFTLHLLGADDSGINAGMVKYPFIKQGESWKADHYVVSPYQGSWHVAARKYRSWADSWFVKRKPMADVVNMNGWQRIIMRHQYGEVHYRYDQLEEICRDGLAVGINTLFMFGWHQGGHDSEYPEYTADESMGGMPALKENIKKLHEAGGKIIVYFNGQLIDMNTKFYDEIGHRISVKKADGREHLEVYPFGGNGTALREFGNKTFVTACPACKEWWNVLKGCIDTAIEMDADGVFFDQLGWVSRPCFDPSHGHPVPLMNPLKYKAEMLDELQRYVKARRPKMPLGIEWTSDVTAQHVDFIHSIHGGATRIDNNWEATGEPPQYVSFAEWFAYIFPDKRTTDRDIRDDTDIERRVNFALVKGLRSDVEIYRCRRTIAETPHYGEYLKRANCLRDKYRSLILNGEFHDDDYFEADTDGLTAACFRNGDEIAVMVTQSHRDNMKFKLDIPGFKLIDTDGLNGWNVTPENDKGLYQVELTRNGLALLHLNTANL